MITIPKIPQSEFAMRRKAAVAQAKDQGLDALLVWSRGGGSVEAYGDVLYLSNFHSLFPVIPDDRGWASRGHAALILPVIGDPVIITDFHDDPEGRVDISDIRAVPDITIATTAALAEMGLLGKRIGLVGANAFLASAERRMRTAPGGDRIMLIPADQILEDLRTIKSEAELDMMRHSASVGVKWMNSTMGALAEGCTEGDAVAEGLRTLASHGGIQQDVAIASGPKASHYFGSSGVPHWNVTRPLVLGDMVHVDQWGPVNTYYTDFARSTVIGGNPNAAQKNLLEGSIGVIEHIIDGIRPSVSFGDLFARGALWMESNGLVGPRLSTQKKVAQSDFGAGFPSFGHSLGLGNDAPNIIEGSTLVVKPNMVLAIEIFVEERGVGASNFEQNLIVHADRLEVLTEACQKRWWN